jgi:hypothetical protein
MDTIIIKKVEEHTYLNINNINNNNCVSSQESELSCICVLRISIVSLATINLLYFGTVTEDENWNYHDWTKCHNVYMLSIWTNLY